MLRGMRDDICANKITASGERQHGHAAGHEDNYLGLGG